MRHDRQVIVDTKAKLVTGIEATLLTCQAELRDLKILDADKVMKELRDYLDPKAGAVADFIGVGEAFGDAFCSADQATDEDAQEIARGDTKAQR